MMWDIIIVSNAHDEARLKLTVDTVNSLYNSQCDIKFKVTIVEQQKHIFYKDIHTLHYDFDFNYNKCLNYAISKTNHDIIVLCNNDLAFSKGWAEKLNVGFSMGYESLSPICSKTMPYKPEDCLMEGYGIAYHIAVWCIAVTRELHKKIGGFNESVDFWYSDNIYAQQLISFELRHALVCNSIVDHLGSMTIKDAPTGVKKYYTQQQSKKYQDAMMEVYAKKKKSLR